jgi:hypothetical protein
LKNLIQFDEVKTVRENKRRVARKIAGYKGASKRLFKDSGKQRDLRQASEKLWGAAALMVKAVAEERGWKHDGHAELFRAVDKIIDASKDYEIYDLFQVANSLHANFYEGWMTKKQIKMEHICIKKFLEKLEKLSGRIWKQTGKQ